MLKLKNNKLLILFIFSFFCFNIYILSINAIKENTESLITTSYFEKKYIVSLDDLLEKKIKKDFNQYLINKKKFYNNNNFEKDILYDNLSKKINVFKEISLNSNQKIIIERGKKIILISGKILLLNGKLINLSKSTLLSFNNYLFKNALYMSYEKSCLKANNNNAILFLSN